MLRLIYPLVLLSTFAVTGLFGAGPPKPPPGLEIADLPDSAFRRQLESLPPQARAAAMNRFQEFKVPMADVASIRADRSGRLFYACQGHVHELKAQPFYEEPELLQLEPVSGATVPISNPPVLHSREGAPYVIYLDFNGGVVSGKAWENADGVTEWDTKAFSKDSDHTTFSDAEQDAIRQIWQRISEDYAPFNVNVSTDPAFDPDVTGGASNIGWVLFTDSTDKTGVALPFDTAGGVAYVGVYGQSNYAFYQPAFVYANNLGPDVEQFMAEAGAHEMGHNMGLSHDGTDDGTNRVEYYSGHGSGETQWAPIMGGSYRRNVSTWSKGEYHDANNTEDDVSIIGGKTGYRTDDIGDTPATAVPLSLAGDAIVSPVTTRFVGDDPNEGIINSSTDIDQFSFSTSGGPVSITATPFVAEDTRYSRGNNLDIKLTLYDASEAIVATVDPGTTVGATLSTSLASGDYTLAIEGTGAGDPFSSTPTGYTDYGSLGMYFISGTIPQPLEITSPSAGETLQPNTLYPVSWIGPASGDLIQLDLYKGGVLQGPIASGIDGANTSYDWTVPSDLAEGSDYTILMTLNADPLRTAESAIFEIAAIAPLVTAQSPASPEELTTAQSQLVLTFNEPIDPATFSIAGDISSFTGPQGIDLSASLTGAGWDVTRTRLTLEFLSQSDPGYYRLVLQPAFTDTEGTAPDQDGDGLPGEPVEDAYVAIFLVSEGAVSGRLDLYATGFESDPGWLLDSGWEWGPPAQSAIGGPAAASSGSHVIATNLAGSYAPNLNPPIYANLPEIDTTGATQIELQFTRWLGVSYRQTGAPTQRHADTARLEVSTDGSTWTTVYASADAVADSGWSILNYALPSGVENQPTVYLRFGLESDDLQESYGWNIDDLVVSGFVENQADPPPAPVIVGHSPDAAETTAQSVLNISFSQPMDPASFDLTDIVDFTGPNGAISASGHSWLSDSVLRISFPEQSASGTYSLTLGPGIANTFGQEMDQDLDSIPGEAVEDVYTASFTIDIPVEYTAAESWRLENFGTAENSGETADTADFDKDGVSNLLERAFGTDPTNNQIWYQPEQVPVPVDSATYLSITYKRLAGGTGTTGVDYTVDGMVYKVQYNSDLGSAWNAGDVTEMSASDPVDGVQTVTVRLNTPVPTGAVQFIRLEVTSAP